MKLAYRAYDKSGKVVSDTIEAPDAIEAGEALRKKGLFVAEVKVQSGSGRGGDKPVKARRSTARLRTLSMFTRQLHVLISTGTPLMQSLAALERQMKDDSWRRVIKDIRQRVEEGSSLADAMELHPDRFDAVYRSLISAGESGGKLEVMLDRLAGVTRQQLKIRTSLIGALIYPAVLVVVAVVVLTLMIGFLLPRFASLYDTLDASLPPTTSMLLGISGIVRSWWYLIIAGVIGLVFLVRFLSATEWGQRLIHTAIVRAPQFGRIFRSFSTARLTRVIGVLLESHVPLLEALKLARDSTGNVHYAELVDKAIESVTKGESVNKVFVSSPMIDPAIAEAIRSGEQTGQLGPLLLSVSEFLDEDNEVIIRSLMSILEPLILIALGGLVGLIALSMFMPLFDLTAMTGG